MTDIKNVNSTTDLGEYIRNINKSENISPFKEEVNHPDHYNYYPIEVIDMMVAIWGVEKIIDFCYINAFKYRMRAGLKNLFIAEDLNKEKWYLEKAYELKKRITM